MRYRDPAKAPAHLNDSNSTFAKISESILNSNATTLPIVGWKIDPKRGKIAFNNWTEMGLFGGVSATVAATLAFWIS